MNSNKRSAVSWDIRICPGFGNLMCDSGSGFEMVIQLMARRTPSVRFSVVTCQISKWRRKQTIQMQQQLYPSSRQEQGVVLASLGKPPLSIWQSAVLAYASAKCGIAFTSIEQTDTWLRTNIRHPQHLIVRVAFGLLLVEPPSGAEMPAPASPRTAPERG
jgi:hypothetical protein